MTVTQVRPAAVKMNLQRHNSSVSTINHGFCYPPGASLFALDHVATVRPHLPRQTNPHSRLRGTFRAPSPAGSFLGGFQTPATGLGFIIHGRRLKPCTRHTSCRRNYVSITTGVPLIADALLRSRKSAELGQRTKSLRSSPLRGAVSRETGDKWRVLHSRWRAPS